ncbi:TonB-dependent receptor [Caulobacter sp. Root1455]|uniref:TonB-dependent receptor n=1 Tax=unclassified Caulobacter TaxID=2648921 RepID=UPI000701B490|nr:MULTISPECIES: TonB-dependent receptor [unclassified Caulobacter]KQY35750.1 TonB-dependent receptor [Caulobacter sp. Root487D2Y]KQZ06282.1 TonB-dependent receptor [Caulobacter sp. Root1455]
MRFTQVLCGTASAVVLAGLTPIAAQAQDTETQTVDSIVVTAQKREQNLQDVPVVVTAVGAKLLRDTGVKDIKDLTILTPGLTVTSTSSEASTTARIRGVGTVGDNPGLESSVGVVIDGVYRPRNGVGFGDLGEMERIEVLKGPQGTLFGKNTSAGVINIITKEPEFGFGAEAEATLGNYNAHGLAGSVTGPLFGSETLAARLYVAARERDGYNDVVTGKGPSTRDQDADQGFYTVRGQLLFVPDDKSSFKLIGDYSKRDENCCGAVQIRPGPTTAIINALAGGKGVGASTDNPYDRVAYSNRGAPSSVEDKGVSLEGNIDLPIGALTSISAIRQWRTDNGQDADFTTADLVYRNKDGTNYSEFTTFTQELRLAGKTDRFDWLVGAFLADERLDSKANFLYGNDYEAYLGTILLSGIANSLAPAGITLNQAGSAGFISQATGRPYGTSYTGGQGLRDQYKQRATTVALFTNDTWHVTDAFDLTVGLRYSIDKKDLDTYQSTTDGGVACGTALTPAGQARIAGALVARGVPAGLFAPGNPTGASLVSTVAGNMCLPWANPLFNGRGTTQNREDKEWSGTIKGSYRFSPEVFAYASYARGYKGGGFNLDRTQSSNGQQSGGNGVIPIHDTSFPGEFVDSYEVGMKNTLFNRTVLLNLTAFYQEYSDFQLNTFLGTSFVVRSIPEVTSQGVDADFIWFTPVHGLSVQSGFTYADTKYGDQPIPNDPGNALALLPGSNLSLAPKYSLSGSLSYEHPVGDTLKARFNIGAKYSSEYNTGSDLFPPKMQDAYTVVNARVSLGDADDKWTAELWAQNLLDEEYKQVAFNGTLQGSSGLSATNKVYKPALDTITYDAFLGAPRTYGVTLRAKF